MQKIFIDGIARSGTSFLSRLVNSFPETFIVGDGLRIAKEILVDIEYINRRGRRYPVAMYKNKKINLQKPILHPEAFAKTIHDEITMLENTIQAPFPENAATELRSYCKSTISENQSYAEFFQNFFAILAKTTQSQNIGTKTTHHSGYIRDYLSAWPDAKWIALIRDPRANYASFKVSHKASLYEFCRKRWNKNIKAVIKAVNDPEYAKRVLVLKYEDLMLNSEKEVAKIADFLNIEIAPAEHIKSLDFRRSDGTQWFQNTSFDKDDTVIKKDGWNVSNRPICKYFDSQPVERWKRILTKSEIRKIELLSAHAMKLVSYKKYNV
jgi:hypothetical protein